MLTAIEPEVNKTGRYGIGEAAELLGIHRNTLRNYTEQGLIKCGIKRQTGKKFYQGSEILRFWRAM